ncbi:MAG TPA: IPT/TIG domain-containing protein [Verrucomicrobiae bacterium]|nr:IPT/TIG domain-containing protein [Verrucomicrobiae bacterium]
MEFSLEGSRLAILAVPFLWVLSPCPAATPAPVVQSVTDSAGYGPRVAPGSLASIFGTNLASGEASATGFPLPTSLGGTSVTMGGTTAPLLYVNSGQINFQVPSSLKSGTVSLTVQGPSGTSASFNVTVTSSAPAIFQYGDNHAVAQNGGALNSSSAPAASGSVVTVYLTGIGAVDNAVADGVQTPSSPLSTATATPTATIGAQSATVQFLGLTPGFAGLAQANILVPTLPTGDYPLVLTVGGYLSASATLSVSGSGSPYTSPLQLTGAAQFVNTANSTIALFNNVAYVCGTNRIVMVDVTSPSAPSVIGELGDAVLNGNGNSCAINAAASTPYLVEIIGTPTSAQSFAIYGLSNPRAPNLLDIASTNYMQMVAMSFAGNYVYVTTSFITYYTNGHAIIAQNGDFLVFDFTNPAYPLFLGSLQPATPNLKPDVEAINQVYAYVAGSTATGTSTSGQGLLNVINAATPSNPFLLNQVTVSQAAILLSFDISGNTLLAAGNTVGQRNPGVPDFAFTGNLTLTTMDLSNVQAPAVIGTFTTNLQVNGTFYVAAFPNSVFAIVNNPPATDTFGPPSLMLVDARQPATIVPYPIQTQFGFSGIVATTANYLLAPTLFGLNIYQLQL